MVGDVEEVFGLLDRDLYNHLKLSRPSSGNGPFSISISRASILWASGNYLWCPGCLLQHMTMVIKWLFRSPAHILHGL